MEEVYATISNNCAATINNAWNETYCYPIDLIGPEMLGIAFRLTVILRGKRNHAAVSGVFANSFSSLHSFKSNHLACSYGQHQYS